MKKSGVYAINENAIANGETNAGMRGFSATLIIPSKMRAGDDKVEAIAIQNGAELSRTGEDLTLELSGLPKTISALVAYGRPLLFGFMAVFIALAAGLIIGVIFQGGGGAH